MKEIKSHASVDEYLLNNNVYITKHFFKDFVIDIGTLGWIYGEHPTHHDKETIKIGMMDEI